MKSLISTLVSKPSRNAALLLAAAGSAAVLTGCVGSAADDANDDVVRIPEQVDFTHRVTDPGAIITVQVHGLAQGSTIKISDGISGDTALALGTSTSTTTPQALTLEASWGLPKTFGFDATLKGSFPSHVAGTKYTVTATTPTLASGSTVALTPQTCTVSSNGAGTLAAAGVTVTVSCAITPVSGHSLFVTQSSQNNAFTPPAVPTAGPNVNVANVFGANPATGPFAFGRVWNQIAATGALQIALTGTNGIVGSGAVVPVSTTITPASTTTARLTGGPGIYQQLIDTMNGGGSSTFTTGPHCGSSNEINAFATICPMPEGQMAGQPRAGATYNAFTPIALVNRFDTAGGKNCGQHRIVYALPEGTDATDTQRFLMIFEAVLPNPDPTGNATSCLPVAQFWDDLSSPLLTDAQRVAMLDTFYFTGIQGTSASGTALQFQPVVMAQHYGVGSATDSVDTGQIRANMLEASSLPELTDWDLREFRLSQTCVGTTCTLTANNTVVQNNPNPSLFSASASGGALTAFQTSFVSQIPDLAATTVAGIAWTIPAADDSTDSIEEWAGSQTISLNNDYVQQGCSSATSCTLLSPAFSSAISAALAPINTARNLTGTSALTVKNMIDRAETQSCAGCHQVAQANGTTFQETVLGGGLPSWPSSNGFTQISELGPNASTGTFGTPTLSPALTGTFLPARGTNLTTFINASGGM